MIAWNRLEDTLPWMSAMQIKIVSVNSHPHTEDRRSAKKIIAVSMASTVNIAIEHPLRYLNVDLLNPELPISANVDAKRIPLVNDEART